MSVLKQSRDDLDAAVFDAYGWTAALTDEETLSRVVALNAARAEEERAGTVRWLRPASQNPTGKPATQTTMADGADDAATESALDAWPKRAGEQFVAVRGWSYAAPEAMTVDDTVRRF